MSERKILEKNSSVYSGSTLRRSNGLVRGSAGGMEVGASNTHTHTDSQFLSGVDGEEKEEGAGER